MSISSPLPLSKPALSRLYLSIGGEDGLGRILERFYFKLSHDPMVGFFFDQKNLEHIISQQKSFLMRAMGATPHYTGLPPARAHQKLAPILPGHFDRRLQILREVLTAHALPQEDIEVWIQFENSFRQGIVRADPGHPTQT